MDDQQLKHSVKRAVGNALADEPGHLCMQTRCQDIVPRILATVCKEAARGKQARALCKPLLQSCQSDPTARSNCSKRCARYFEAQPLNLKQCISDCNLARCRLHPPYDTCVARHTLLHVLQCVQNGPARQTAQQCLKTRCSLQVNESASFVPHS
ncbi:hypothetical protein BWQ96_07708 [Gracilariopsis chorda]|uniref:Uncharacterized protein n=1 Tax=Gracilariopsis chorda TaxID=448386 RepID=A0A2V3IKC2_9FLOR|nr:hypothetical protein BWQ96_07708 [Gracilariopsis chorda]|eukprot:PXF42546.1 hypothetical protein BWQ96_07708 [Gracilariopsis chorda]